MATRKGRLGRSGLQEGDRGMMEPPVKSGQDGFGVPSHVGEFAEGECTSPQVGIDDPDAPDPHGVRVNIKPY